MTQTDNTDSVVQQPPQQSLSVLPDSPELLRVRILPAQFARALGVSKQSVSRWLRDGWVTLAADGRLDPTVAIGQLLRRCDPGRMRARWLRQAIGEIQGLREAAALSDQRVAELEKDLAFLQRYADDADCMIDAILELVVQYEPELRETKNSEQWAELVGGFESAAAKHCDPESIEI